MTQEVVGYNQSEFGRIGSDASQFYSGFLPMELSRYLKISPYNYLFDSSLYYVSELGMFVQTILSGRNPSNPF